MDENRIIFPLFCARIRGRARWIIRTAPSTLTSSSLSNSSTVVFSQEPSTSCAAAQTSTSTRFSMPRAFSVKAVQLSSLVTSNGRTVTPSPSGEVPAAKERAPAITLQPFWAKACAVARPSPPDAPMTQTIPFCCIMLQSSVSVQNKIKKKTGKKTATPLYGKTGPSARKTACRAEKAGGNGSVFARKEKTI